MPDERVAPEPVDEIGQLRLDLEDLKRTMLVRADRSPVGTIEPTLRTVAMTDTVLLQGQTLQRSDFVALWEWVSGLGLADAGIFGQGDGVNTFKVPDMRGRVILGAGTLSPDTYAVGATGGASTRVIVPDNMAAHTHQIAVANHTIDVGSDEVSHTHGFGTSGVGDHGGHHFANAPGVGGSGASWPTIAHVGQGAHGHSGGTGNASNAHGHYAYVSPHSVAQTVVGKNTPFDVRSPYIALNWLLWT